MKDATVWTESVTSLPPPYPWKLILLLQHLCNNLKQSLLTVDVSNLILSEFHLTFPLLRHDRLFYQCRLTIGQLLLQLANRRLRWQDMTIQTESTKLHILKFVTSTFWILAVTSTWSEALLALSSPLSVVSFLTRCMRVSCSSFSLCSLAVKSETSLQKPNHLLLISTVKTGILSKGGLTNLFNTSTLAMILSVSFFIFSFFHLLESSSNWALVSWRSCVPTKTTYGI